MLLEGLEAGLRTIEDRTQNARIVIVLPNEETL